MFPKAANLCNMGEKKNRRLMDDNLNKFPSDGMPITILNAYVGIYNDSQTLNIHVQIINKTWDHM